MKITGERIAAMREMHRTVDQFVVGGEHRANRRTVVQIEARIGERRYGIDQVDFVKVRVGQLTGRSQQVGAVGALGRVRRQRGHAAPVSIQIVVYTAHAGAERLFLEQRMGARRCDDAAGGRLL